MYASAIASLLIDIDEDIFLALESYDSLVDDYDDLMDVYDDVREHLANITYDVERITADLVLANDTAAQAEAAYLERQAILENITTEGSGVSEELSSASVSLDTLRQKLLEAKLAASRVTESNKCTN